MMSTSVRRIKTVWKSEPTIEGAGVHLRRAFGNREVPQFDPFLLLDDFRSDNPQDYIRGFPWHPHRGIETITYVLDGQVEHEDSLGNGGVIRPGEVHWMTAGSGIMHQEMPKGDRHGRMDGFQLWANLPASHKMMQPRYRAVAPADIPVIKKEDAVIRVIAGRQDGAQGPVRDVVTEPQYLDITVHAQSRFALPVPAGHTVLAYVIEGQGYFDPSRDAYEREQVGVNYFDMERQCVCDAHTLVQYQRDGDAIQIETKAQPVRFILASGRPLGEPVAWYGPIVMNTRAELRQAFDDLERGTFIKEPAS
jgi:quercetin 2,3-dioxygenase